ncbi:MAG: superoxide dismutase family protein [Proteobacteria bacterium]|nr:superoxide dismutase family protein [Pseudomonadota bacterium]
MFSSLFIAVIFILFSINAMAAGKEITVYKIIPNSNTSHVDLGTIVLSDTTYGLLITPNLNTLPPGVHAMMIYQNPSCAKGGLAAGGVWNPHHSGKHQGPYDNAGYLGDLPALTVTADGKAILPVLAPRLKLKDLTGHSLIIHVGDDNYSDDPPLGGAGARIACAVIQK